MHFIGQKVLTVAYQPLANTNIALFRIWRIHKGIYASVLRLLSSPAPSHLDLIMALTAVARHTTTVALVARSPGPRAYTYIYIYITTLRSCYDLSEY